jgi:hypothetical protein
MAQEAANPNMDYCSSNFPHLDCLAESRTLAVKRRSEPSPKIRRADRRNPSVDGDGYYCSGCVAFRLATFVSERGVVLVGHDR